MKIRFSRGCVLGPNLVASPGDVLDLPPAVAQVALSLRRGELVKDEPPPAVATIENREPVIDNRDPIPAETPLKRLYRRRTPRSDAV